MRTGQIVVVLGYSDRPDVIDSIFRPGDLAVVMDVREEGDMTCNAISCEGKVSHLRSDLLWPEEVLTLNNTPLIISATQAFR